MNPLRIFITGTSRLGHHIAATLQRVGHDVALHYRSTLPTLDAPAFQCDFEKTETLDAFFADLCEIWGCPDVLINVAASFERTPAFDAPAEMFERQWRINTLAPILLSQALHARNPTGHVISLLDQRIQSNDAVGCLPYSLSKKSLHDFTLAAARAWPGFRVNAIAPGAVLPPPNPNHSEEAGAFLCTPPTPEDISHATRFLIETPCVTGQIIYIDGGQHLL